MCNPNSFPTAFLTSASKFWPLLIAGVFRVRAPRITATKVPSAVVQRLTSKHLDAVILPYRSSCQNQLLCWSHVYFSALFILV